MKESEKLIQLEATLPNQLLVFYKPLTCNLLSEKKLEKPTIILAEFIIIRICFVKDVPETMRSFCPKFNNCTGVRIEKLKKFSVGIIIHSRDGKILIYQSKHFLRIIFIASMVNILLIRLETTMNFFWTHHR